MQESKGQSLHINATTHNLSLIPMSEDIYGDSFCGKDIICLSLEKLSNPFSGRMANVLGEQLEQLEYTRIIS